MVHFMDSVTLTPGIRQEVGGSPVGLRVDNFSSDQARPTIKWKLAPSADFRIFLGRTELVTWVL